MFPVLEMTTCFYRLWFDIGQHDIALESITTYMKSNPNDAKGRALQDMLSVKLPADHEKNVSFFS